jgi:hypothetical protein
MLICRKAIILAVIISSVPVFSASAVTVEVAKKCDALVAKQFPPRVPGNPASGSAQGSALQQRAFFQKCVDNNGNVDASDAVKSK